MKLRDLNGSFIVATEGGTRYVATLDEAQGVDFQCPKCAEGKEPGEEDGRRFVRGAHYITCWFRNPRTLEPVDAHRLPVPGRWYVTPESTGLEDLTFGPGPDPEKPSSFSVLLQGPGCGWHGFIRNGEATLS